MNLLPLPIRIRPMKMADLEQVQEIAWNLRQAPRWSQESYVKAIEPQALPQRVALVAEDLEMEQVAGFAVAMVLTPEAELETIAVAAGLQRRGVAQQLFVALAGELRRLWVTEVILEVRVSNLPALELYRSFGFEENGRRPRYYADPVEDAILMSLLLPRA
jgi:ribosomal-protein-alanine N-acetyltransferase